MQTPRWLHWLSVLSIVVGVGSGVFGGVLLALADGETWRIALGALLLVGAVAMVVGGAILLRESKRLSYR
ncbi:hypothetical protein ACFSBZ_01305 [Amnibacterium flavum]|nr:hypothetical protein [Amnibacterium flavum]